MSITASITTVQSATYVGQTWYDLMGMPMDETGHSSPQEAARRISEMEQRLAGKWCFAVVKTRHRQGGIDIWTNAVLFPDGKTRKLVQGEVANSQRSKGTWIKFAEITKAALNGKCPAQVRQAPDIRFPWHSNACEAKLERFKTMIEVERWLSQHAKLDSIVFCFEPGSHVRPPDEEGVLFAYLAVVPK